MNTLIVFGILLTSLSALIGVLCTLLYLRVGRIDSKALENQEHWLRMEVKLQELSEIQGRLYSRIDQLSVDVLHREIYQGPDDRHQQAIKAAKEGVSVTDLMHKHGLSPDEASLVMALHGQSGQAASHHGSVVNSVA